MSYLTQLDRNTWLHACDVIGVQDITEAHHQQHEDDEQEPLVIVSLINGTSCAVRAPLKVVLMTIDEAIEQHGHAHGEEEE